jgi:hypothetical protein
VTQRPAAHLRGRPSQAVLSYGDRVTELRTDRAAAAAVQVAVGVAAHTCASGCLPALPSLAIAVPLALFGVLLLGRAFTLRPLIGLAGGQFTVHVALSISAACAGAHNPHLPMTYAHVAAVVLLGAGGDRVARTLDDAVRAMGRVVPRLLLVVPTIPANSDLLVAGEEPDVTPLRLQHLPAPTGRRGPPAATFAPTPA